MKISRDDLPEHLLPSTFHNCNVCTVTGGWSADWGRDVLEIYYTPALMIWILVVIDAGWHRFLASSASQQRQIQAQGVPMQSETWKPNWPTSKWHSQMTSGKPTLNPSTKVSSKICKWETIVRLIEQRQEAIDSYHNQHFPLNCKRLSSWSSQDRINWGLKSVLRCHR